jgi:hypothetical protein
MQLSRLLRHRWDCSSANGGSGEGTDGAAALRQRHLGRFLYDKA